MTSKWMWVRDCIALLVVLVPMAVLYGALLGYAANRGVSGTYRTVALVVFIVVVSRLSSVYFGRRRKARAARIAEGSSRS